MRLLLGLLVGLVGCRAGVVVTPPRVAPSPTVVVSASPSISPTPLPTPLPSPVKISVVATDGSTISSEEIDSHDRFANTLKSFFVAQRDSELPDMADLAWDVYPYRRAIWNRYLQNQVSEETRIKDSIRRRLIDAGHYDSLSEYTISNMQTAVTTGIQQWFMKHPEDLQESTVNKPN